MQNILLLELTLTQLSASGKPTLRGTKTGYPKETEKETP